jgi:hypothetical protein
MIVISSSSIFIVSVAPVEAIVPQVQDVIVWNNGGDTILNITVHHTPVTVLHHVDRIEVDVDGSITNYPVDQPSTTFIFQANLGQITGTPSARVRAHCTVDGWSIWFETLQIPEFTSWIILPLFMTATFIVIFYRNRLRRKG